MPKITIIFGLILIGIGLTAYFGSDLTEDRQNDEKKVAQKEDSKAQDQNDGGKKRSAITGLAIPGAFGVLLLVSGIVALQESVRKHAMHVAVLVGTLGALGTVGKGGMDLVKLASGNEVNGRAMIFVWLMAVVCIVFVALCVRSFIQARKNREAAEEQAV